MEEDFICIYLKNDMAKADEFGFELEKYNIDYYVEEFDDYIEVEIDRHHFIDVAIILYSLKLQPLNKISSLL